MLENVVKGPHLGPVGEERRQRHDESLVRPMLGVRKPDDLLRGAINDRGATVAAVDILEIEAHDRVGLYRPEARRRQPAHFATERDSRGFELPGRVTETIQRVA